MLQKSLTLTISTTLPLSLRPTWAAVQNIAGFQRSFWIRADCMSSVPQPPDDCVPMARGEPGVAGSSGDVCRGGVGSLQGGSRSK